MRYSHLRDRPIMHPALEEIGAKTVIADALNAAAVKAAVGRIRPDAVINELTSLPRLSFPKIPSGLDSHRKAESSHH